MEENIRFQNRDRSWLSFNYRVLQEAKDPSVPLYEKIKFLAIYSSNLDEFYRVRIPSIRNYKKLRKRERDRLKVQPKKLLQEVNKIVHDQQEEMGRVFREELIPGLKQAHIHLVTDGLLNAEQNIFVEEFFDSRLFNHLTQHYIKDSQPIPFLKDKGIYLVGFFRENKLGIVEIPSQNCGRFIVLPQIGTEYFITYIDDIIRLNFSKIFPHETVEEIISIKVSRDAELYIENEYEGDLIEKIMDSVQLRDKGLPTRFLYDECIEDEHLLQLKSFFKLNDGELIEGARYHNFQDFFSFPDPTHSKSLHDPPLPPLDHPQLRLSENLIESVLNKDYLLSFPYQSFHYIPELIIQAGNEPKVSTIKITLYRVSKDSAIAKALIYAVQKGKTVTAFLELKARFDEESNFYWGAELRDAGVHVIFSFPGIKVHSKLFLIELMDKGERKRIAYLGTGNFNEKTAKMYCDHALLSSHPELTSEASQVFDILERKIIIPQTERLLISPFSLRKKFTEMLDHEINQARQNKEAYIIAKMNSLEDEEMIEKLYEANRAGVKIQIIVRGICRLIAGKGQPGEGIEVRSIVDRFLEHSRVYIFCNGGYEVTYLASADWMTRNLDRRIEVAFPILNSEIKKDIRKVVNLQLKDNTKARSLSIDRENEYCVSKTGKRKIRCQEDIYSYFESQLSIANQSTEQIVGD